MPPRAARRPEPKRRPGKRRKGQRSRKPLLAALAVVLVAGVAVAVVALAGGFGSSSAGPVGPEGVPLESGPALAPAAALPPTQGAGFAVGCGSTEQIATHVHSHLAVYVDGKARSIPLGVGFYGQVQVQSSKHGRFAAGTSNCLYWLHTHAADGIIHVEAPAGRSFVLGQFFGIWGQPLSATQVGGATGRVTAYVDGKRWSGSVDNIPLRSHEDIQLDVGTPLVPPRSVGFPGSL
ncbi:MAG: hypothetical protein ACRDY0_08505 [Acidimicrobiales bacterium]